MLLKVLIAWVIVIPILTVVGCYLATAVLGRLRTRRIARAAGAGFDHTWARNPSRAAEESLLASAAEYVGHGAQQDPQIQP